MAGHRQHHKTSVSKNAAKKKRRKKYPNVFFKEELVKVFSKMEDPKTMVACFVTFICALRQSEVCNLKWKDIDMKHLQVKVIEGKGGKDGYIPLSHVSIQILKKWRKMNPEEEYLLPQEANEKDHMTTKTLFMRFKKALKEAELLIPTEKNSIGYQQHQYKFHTLRHSRCTHLINNGIPLQKVQHFMRHDKIDTTMIYTWITNPELKRMVAEVDDPKTKSALEPVKKGNPTAYKEDPIEIARRRLAYGEIKIKQFTQIIQTLQTPHSL